jgi:signal-transduction protein with cAMP-binding, CBS, and nucleotidyltransferase domain
MARVLDVVRGRELYKVDHRATVREAARLMAEKNIGAVLVFEGGDLRGIFSERDLVRRVVLERRDPDRTPVCDVMTVDVATIEEDATLEEAMSVMKRANCRHLPVVKDGKVVEFLSMRDVSHFELADKTDELRHMHNYVKGA